MPRGIMYDSGYRYGRDWKEGKTLVKTLGETDIYVDQEGTFWAKIDGDLRKRKSLRDLEKIVTRQNAPLRCFTLSRYGPSATHDVDVVAIEPDKRYRLSNNNLVYFHATEGPYLDDPELRAEIDAFVERRERIHRTLEAEYQELLKHGRRPTLDDLLQARAAAAEASSNEPE